MDCRSATRLIPAYLDGELASNKDALLNEHLSSCSSCRAELAALEQAMAAMGARKNIEPAFTLADIEAPSAERQARRGWVSSLNWPWLAPRWATVLGAAVAIFVGAIGGVSLHAVSQPTPPPAASRMVSDVLSLGVSDDPLADLIAEKPSASSPTGSGGREGRL
jgi:predicted anti-sigma-YlaC factor YlaD